ncbi:MAG: hypothetical protein H0V81_11200 [Solirubrobacterales bacterium]|nr:hypothetical protein [Solirubrobacterales bacterium]
MTISIRGKRSRAKRTSGRFVAIVDLRKVPRGKVTLKIRAVTRTGRVLTGRRSYKTCTAKRKGKGFSAPL